MLRIEGEPGQWCVAPVLSPVDQGLSEALATGSRGYEKHEVALRRLSFSLRRQASRLLLLRFQTARAPTAFPDVTLRVDDILGEGRASG